MKFTEMRFMQIFQELCFSELSDFLEYKESQKKSSENTVYNYYRDLLSFFRYMRYIRGEVDRSVAFENITVNTVDLGFIKSIEEDDILRYICYLEEIRNNSPKTIARKQTSIREFFKYLRTEQKIVKKDPSINTAMPDIQKSSLEFITEQECIKLLDSIKGENSERDYCIFVIFINCGLTLSELVGLNDTDIDSNGILTVRGSNGKTRRLLMNKACLEAVEDYKKYKEKFFEGKSYDHHAIFVGRHGKRLTARWIEQSVKKRMKSAGFGDRKISPRNLRHTSAKIMYKRGVDIKVLQKILGHENMNATQVYAENSEDEQIKKAMSSITVKKSR